MRIIPAILFAQEHASFVGKSDPKSITRVRVLLVVDKLFYIVFFFRYAGVARIPEKEIKNGIERGDMKTRSLFKFLLVNLLVLLLSACSSPVLLRSSSAGTTPAAFPNTGQNAAPSPTAAVSSGGYSYGGSASSSNQESQNSAPALATPTLEANQTENNQANSEQNGAAIATEPSQSENGQSNDQNSAQATEAPNPSNNEQMDATDTPEPNNAENNPSSNDQAQATEAPDNSNSEKPTSPPENGAVSACSLVTPADAGEALGETISAPASQSSQGPNQSTCTYAANNKSVVVTAKTFAADQQALDDLNAQMQAQHSNQNFATVEDLGDQAFQYANTVAFAKDQYEVSIQVTYSPDLTSQVNRDKAFELGKTAKENLP